MAIIIILFLIVLNGFFAMAEIAVISSRKSSIQRMARDGNHSAKLALDLLQNPNRFLSSIQIGITLVGVLSGAFGGATIGKDLANVLVSLGIPGGVASFLGVGIVVVFLTYLSLVIGEIVPKRIAMSHANRITLFVARPMHMVSLFSSPFVHVLSYSTNKVLKMLQIKTKEKQTVSEEEVKMLIAEGARSGIFELAEKDIVERTLRLGDKKVSSIMTPKNEIVYIPLECSVTNLKNVLTVSPHAYYPVHEKNVDKISGIVRTEEVLIHYIRHSTVNIQEYLHDAQYVPENMPALKLLEVFRKSGIHMSLVLDEYGEVQGIVSINDILEALVGDIPEISDRDNKPFVRRDDGSWIVDGQVKLDDFKAHFKVRVLPDEVTGDYHTIAGFVMSQLGKVPRSGDKFQTDDFRFEVIDMDGNRVDKIIVKKIND